MSEVLILCKTAGCDEPLKWDEIQDGSRRCEHCARKRALEILAKAYGRMERPARSRFEWHLGRSALAPEIKEGRRHGEG